MSDKAPVSYSARPDWGDVTPIPQADDGKVLAPILYSQEYKEAMDYFRAILQKEEYSERVLGLTEHIIRMNPAHYSVWQYRYRTLIKINSPLDKELELINSMMAQNLKTYQIWHHRRLLQTHLREPYTELAFITKSLRPDPVDPEDDDEDESEDEETPETGVCDNTKPPPTPKTPTSTQAKKPRAKSSVDTKNYHTWAYRQWLLAEFNSPELWAGELEFVDEMLRHDIRNNSAWHHRFFVTFDSGIREGEEDRQAVARREIDYAKDKISYVPNNASAWNYLRGVLRTTQTPFEELEAFVIPYTLPAASALKSEETIDLENPRPSPGAQLPCALAIELLADIYLEKAAGGDGAAADCLKKADDLFTSLATEHDTIRRKYWDYRRNKAKKQLADQ
ncbi:CAAX geranylgeranyltransferase alpha subunit [Tulasnella sp. 424]|nr:CAAX geranylgeranyltransferase alpha subunit [Tulasnella sp. 424]